MKKAIAIISVFVTLCVLTFTQSACLRIGKPSQSRTLRIFNKERESFELVADYLKGLEYSSCLIKADNGEYFAEFEYHEIGDSTVVEAVKSLWKKGCTNIYKDDKMNSISFLLWYNDQDVACGMLTRIRENEDAIVQFMTEIEKPYYDWYYYVSDYNKWRTYNY